MKKYLSLFISFVMLFNLTAEVFAQQINIKKQNHYGLKIPSVEKDVQQMKREAVYNNAYYTSLSRELQNSNPNAVNKAKFDASMAVIGHLDKEFSQLTLNPRELEIAQMLGANFEQFKTTLEEYSKETGEEINILDSWREYVKDLNNYYKDYHSLVQLFEKLDFTSVMDIDLQTLRNESITTIEFKNKTYDKKAFLHASIHNIITRKKNGFYSNGMWVWSKEEEEDFTLEQKIRFTKHIYYTIAQYGCYPADYQPLWSFVVGIVEQGKKYFNNDLYFADIFPHTASQEAIQERDSGKDQRYYNALNIVYAMSILPMVSYFESEKEKSSEVVYQLIKNTKEKDYASLALFTGSKVLIALNTKSSLDKLLILLNKDLKSFSFGDMIDFLSLEKMSDNDNDLIAELYNSERYNNPITLQFTYLSTYKNDIKNIQKLNQDILNIEGYHNLIYTNIFEDIGRELGSEAENPDVQKVIDHLANTFINKDTPLRGAYNVVSKVYNSMPIGGINNPQDIDFSLPVIIGVLETTTYHSPALTEAANIIYNTTWWDINEATQRDKKNIAAKYLNKPRFSYDNQKDALYKMTYLEKIIARNADKVLALIMMTTLIMDAPAILRSIDKFVGNSIKTIKTLSGETKNIFIHIGKRNRIKTAPKYSPTQQSFPITKPAAIPEAKVTHQTAQAKPAAMPEAKVTHQTAQAKPAVAESKPVSKTASTPKPTENRQPAKEPTKSVSQVQEPPQGIATDLESNEIVELRKKIQRIETEKNAVIEEINTKLSNINGQHFENTSARANAKNVLQEEKKNIERFASEKIEELQNQINTLKTKTPKENTGRNAKIKDIIANRRKFNADIEKVKGNSQIKPVPMENDPTAMYNYLRNNDLIFKSKRDVDIYIKRKSNKIFKDFNAFKTAYENPNHPLHKHAVIFSETDPAFMDVEFTISNKTPGFNTLESKELRIPVSKLAANYTQANNFINIKPIKNSSGKILGFDLLPIHTHGVNLDKYLPRLMNGDVLGVIRKTDKELLVIYDKVKNNEYVIGIIRENNQRGVNLLTTNYNVQTTMKGLGEQFIKYADTGDGMRKIIGFNQNEIIYLKQPSVSTIYNQNAPAELVKDIDKLVKDIKIGDTYKAWEP